MVIARVIESTKMDTGQIRVSDVNALDKDISDKGRTNVYGILFDFDKADIKPESQPQLKAIADLLTKSPSLKLDIVGHTDNQGGAAYNLKLSDRRAFSVMAELIGRYGIERDRLTAHGMGLAQPVASNADEAGRALNRRVELIKR
jgi:outer membrane protein OmpA-like peptidoglycan-associated protein